VDHFYTEIFVFNVHNCTQFFSNVLSPFIVNFIYIFIRYSRSLAIIVILYKV
jgi:hypothetical protein